MLAKRLRDRKDTTARPQGKRSPVPRREKRRAGDRAGRAAGLRPRCFRNSLGLWRQGDSDDDGGSARGAGEPFLRILPRRVRAVQSAVFGRIGKNQSRASGVRPFVWKGSFWRAELTGA